MDLGFVLLGNQGQGEVEISRHPSLSAARLAAVDLFGQMSLSIRLPDGSRYEWTEGEQRCMETMPARSVAVRTVAPTTASSPAPDVLPGVMEAVVDGVTTVAHGVGHVVGTTAKGAVDVTCAIGEGIGAIVGGLLD